MTPHQIGPSIAEQVGSGNGLSDTPPDSSRDQLRTQHLNGLCVVTLNRPDRKNALTRELRLQLAQLVIDLSKDEENIGLVLASKDIGFSAGQDLNEAKDFATQYIPTWIDEHIDLYRALLTYPKPSIAAIDGCCVGAGLQIALLCDLRFATPEAFFMMPEIDDAIPCILGTWLLWDVVGRARTADMVLTNRRVEAAEAAGWGLVNRIADRGQLIQAATLAAEAMAMKPRLAFRLTKHRLATLAMRELADITTSAQYAHMVAFNSGQPAHAMHEFLAHGRTGPSV